MLGLAALALLFDGLAALALLFGLPLGQRTLLFRKLGRLFIFELAGALLYLRLQILPDLGNIGIGEHARMAFRRDLHLLKPIEQFLTGHAEFFCQLMYTHAGHTFSSFYPVAPRIAFFTSKATRS